MASGFASLKKSSSSNFDALTKKLSDMNSSYSNPDDGKYWQPTVDNNGNGFATIRFLDKPDGEDDQYVRLWSHGFKGPGGKWYIENCLSTIGKDDPVNELNNKLWNSGREDDKKTVSRQKRKLHYISNIMVVDDPSHPENNGKVFLFKYGAKIFAKISDLMAPEFPDEKPCNPFDLFNGCNFRLKIRKVEGYRNYDKSEFDSPTPFLEDESKMEETWLTCHSLKVLIADDQFKDYAVLLKQMNSVLGLDSSPLASQEQRQTQESSMETTTKVAETKTTAKVADTPVEDTAENVDDDDMSFFEGLLSDD